MFGGVKRNGLTHLQICGSLLPEVLSFLDNGVLLRIYPEDSGIAGIHWPVTNCRNAVSCGACDASGAYNATIVA
ncbi:hypothetical protein ACLKA6_005769 [Drosophila palustris]